MKKVLSVLLVGLMCISLMVGCSDEEKVYEKIEGDNLSEAEQLYNLGVQAIDFGNIASEEVTGKAAEYNEMTLNLADPLLESGMNDVKDFYLNSAEGIELNTKVLLLRNHLADDSKDEIKKDVKEIKKILDKIEQKL